MTTATLNHLEIAFAERKNDVESSAASSQCVFFQAADLIELDACLAAVEKSMALLREHIALEKSALEQAAEFKQFVAQQVSQTELLRSLLPRTEPDARSHGPLRSVDVAKTVPETPRPHAAKSLSSQPAAARSSRQPDAAAARAAPVAAAKLLKTPASVRKPAATVQQPFNLHHKAPSPAKPKAVPVEISLDSDRSSDDADAHAAAADGDDTPIVDEECAAAASADQRDHDFGPIIDDVSEAELRACPDYMRGRLDVARVNDLVEKLRAILRRKYAVLRLPTKKMSERQLADYQAYIARETPLTRKQMWFSDVDIRQAGDIKIDNNLKNILMILRHLGRLKQDNKRLIVSRPSC